MSPDVVEGEASRSLTSKFAVLPQSLQHLLHAARIHSKIVMLKMTVKMGSQNFVHFGYRVMHHFVGFLQKKNQMCGNLTLLP